MVKFYLYLYISPYVPHLVSLNNLIFPKANHLKFIHNQKPTVQSWMLKMECFRNLSVTMKTCLNRISLGPTVMFRIFSEFLVIFRHFSEYLAQKLVYSESLDFVVLGRSIFFKLNYNNYIISFLIKLVIFFISIFSSLINIFYFIFIRF
jgi:hypothetical protein